MPRHLFRLAATTILPRPVLTWVKKHYYANDVKNFWEDDVAPVKALVKPGDSVIDMGANFGWYTHVLSSAVGPSGKVYSIEPIPDTFKVLKGVIRKLRLENAFPMNYAMSNVDGTTVMSVPQHEYGGNNFYRAQVETRDSKAIKAQKTYKVPMRSLDSQFLSMANQITFIKCDVEGHELPVVKGGTRFFERSKPAWLMEVGGNPDQKGTASHELFRIMEHYGYGVYFFDGKLIRPRPAGHWCVNYLMLQPNHCRELAHLMI